MDVSLIDKAIVFLPLVGFLIAGLGGHRLGDRLSQLITSALVTVSALMSIYVFHDVAFVSGAREHVLAPWLSVGGTMLNWAVKVDTLTAVMMLVVTSVSALVHIYSIGYMHHDRGVPRFMAYLSLFTFFMLMLVSADNLVQMFFGWEGVGLSSYLLIGFWYDKPSARKAAMKAFWVNRVGDFGFLLGIFACYQMAGALDFVNLFKNAPQLVDYSVQFGQSSCNALTLICLLFFMGAMGKSAQLGLHTWLPDAMEGPTPVSALIHAATMVTAGVFMVARLSPLFELAPTALAVVACVGAATAFIAATIGMTQYDIKRVIAYSTMSQLGYMFFAAGVSAYGASIFHLATHAFFKALLFLAAGSVIHAMSGEQDMRKMGGLWRKIPYTYALMWIGSLSLAGIGIEGLFGFAGAYSKDMILEAAYAHGTWYGILAFVLGIMAAFMTAFYSWRLIVLTFHGQARGEAQGKAHESLTIMLAPLVPLALGAIFAGFVGHEWFASAANGAFWQNAIFVKEQAAETGHHVPWLIKLLPLLMALAGIGLAIKLYVQRPYIILSIVQRLGLLYKLVANKYYIDEIYDRLFVRTLPRLGGVLWHKVDEGVIDGFGPDGVAVVVQKSGERLRRIQTGYLYHYAFGMLAGVTLLVLWPFIVRLYVFFWGGLT